MLVKEIDRVSTKKNAEKVLKRYRHYVKMASSEYTPKVTATFSLEPRVGGVNKSVENDVIKNVQYWDEVQRIEKAFNRIVEAEARQVLYVKFMMWEKNNDYIIYNSLGLSESSFYRVLSRGLLEFAENYKMGELLVYRKSLGEK